jgi:hypothetical protein
MTRRCFFASAGLGVAASAAIGGEPATNTSDLPTAAVLHENDTKTFLLVFRTGQEVMKGLQTFARQHMLVAGQVTGIGAVSDSVIGYFDPEKKSYLRLHESGQHELLSLTGNLALYENEPFFHIHVALGMRDGRTCGGHLLEMKVQPTVELILTAYSRAVSRKIDPEWGLPLLVP